MSGWCRAIDDVDDLLHVCRMCHKCMKCHDCSKTRKSKHCGSSSYHKHGHHGHHNTMHISKLCVGEIEGLKCAEPCKGEKGDPGPPGPVATLSHIHALYYDTFVTQTVLNGGNVKFNITGVKSSDVGHSDTVNNDVITLANAGVYKVDFNLTLDPQSDTSAPPDDHVFAVVVNGSVNAPSKSGNGQHNSIATYQITGSTILNVLNNNTTISLRNVGATPVTLAKSLDTTTVVGAYITLIKLA